MRLHMQIDGMTCGHCTARVERALGELEGISQVEVELEPGVARFEVDDAIGADALWQAKAAEAVEDAGYDVLGLSAQDGAPQVALQAPELVITSASADAAPLAPPALLQAPHDDAELVQVQLDVRGMTCASCVARVERALEALPGASKVNVNFATEVASVSVPKAADLGAAGLDGRFDAFERAVQGAGYEVERAWVDGALADTAHVGAAEVYAAGRSEQGSISARRAREAARWRARWSFGLALTPPIMFLQMGPMWFDLHPSGGLELGRLWILAYLTALVLGYTGKSFFEGAWAGLKHRSANMDTLVALGAGASFVASLGLTLAFTWGYRPSGAHLEVYYDGAAMILTLISVGKWLESRAKGVASQALEAIMQLGAKSAQVRVGSQWVERAVEQLKVGDEILVSAGEKIPTDGVVIEGQAQVDESMMTGESVPVHRVEGDEVFGASLNTDGRLVVRATRVGAQTALAQIAKQVEQAQGSKAEIQKLADKISGVFVPVILVIALLTFVGWWTIGGAAPVDALLPMIAVLVVACPCALGLATPTAVMVGTATSAKQGILIRDANALERARKMDVMIMDKTGTLTQGKMQVTDVALRQGQDEAEFWASLGALEQSSTHPIAKALVSYASTRDGGHGAVVSAFQSVVGEGVAGQLQGRAFWAGKLEWVAKDRALAAELDALKGQWRDEGKTVIALADEAQVLGLVALRDEPKADAKAVVAALEQRGVKVWMVTGDDPKTARSIAQQLGIMPQHVRAGVKPEQKAEIVREIRALGGERPSVVGMVGDGINDAPALAEADLGIALGSGADVAMEAADMTLVGDSLGSVLRAVEVASATYRKIRQNLFWAFVYNVILVPVAALGFLVPALAASAMALSSVSVVSNSLLLGRKLKPLR